MADRKEGRGGIVRLLLQASRLLTITSIILAGTLLAAGTYTYMNPRRPLTLALGLRELSLASYGGIAIDDDSPPGQPDFYMQLHVFPNAFGWTCDYCRSARWNDDSHVVIAGVVSSGPKLVYDPLRFMNDSLKDLAPPRPYPYDDSWSCDPKRLDACQHKFLAAWYRSGGYKAAPAMVGFICYTLGLMSSVIVLANELLIAYKPRWMYCRCYFKRWCPYPKGDAEEVDALEEHFWDGLRVPFVAASAGFFTLAALHDTALSILFLRYLEYLDLFMPEGKTMDPQRGPFFLAVVWSMVTCAALSLVFVEIRYHLNRTSAGWIETQDMGDFDSPEGVKLDSGGNGFDSGDEMDPPPAYSDAVHADGELSASSTPEPKTV